MLPSVPELLAYTSLCWPILEYVDVLKNQPGATSIQEIEAVQNWTMKFVESIRGRYGITEGRTIFELHELKDRRSCIV